MMKKINLKKFRSHTITFIVGVLIATTATSYAAVGDKVEAIFADFNLVINGQVKTMDTVPLIYNGTSYIPLRSISNLLGYDVTYRADSRTIELNQSVTGSVYGGNGGTVTGSVYATPSPAPVSIVTTQEPTITHVVIKEIEHGDDGVQFATDNGIDYILLRSVAITYEKNGYDFLVHADKKTLYLISNDIVGRDTTKNVTILENIPYHLIDSQTYIEYDYYKNTLEKILQ